MEMQLYHQDRAVLFVVRTSLVAKSPCLHNHTFMSIEVCENGDKEYLPGEAFNIDCNTW